MCACLDRRTIHAGQIVLSGFEMVTGRIADGAGSAVGAADILIIMRAVLEADLTYAIFPAMLRTLHIRLCNENAEIRCFQDKVIAFDNIARPCFRIEQDGRSSIGDSIEDTFHICRIAEIFFPGDGIDIQLPIIIPCRRDLVGSFAAGPEEDVVELGV